MLWPLEAAEELSPKADAPLVVDMREKQKVSLTTILACVYWAPVSY